MYFVNKTPGTIVLASVLNGEDLVIEGNSQSHEVVPNKELLRKALANRDALEFHATTGSQVEAIHELDSRFDTLLILD